MFNVRSILRDIRVFKRILVPVTIHQRTIINVYENDRIIEKKITTRADMKLEEVPCNPVLNFFGVARWFSDDRYEPKEVWLEDIIIDKAKA